MAQATAQATKNTITLKGSAAIVAEFFGYSINSILYQRGIYDPESFTPVKKYGLQLLVSTDEGLQNYLKKVLGQLSAWLEGGLVKQLVVVISSVETEEVLERWVFNVSTDDNIVQSGGTAEKSEATIKKEIAVIIRQITSSVSFLPLLETACTFDMLVYTNSDCDVPEAWEESDPKYIAQSAEVRLHSFTTKIHRVEPTVSYKAPDDELEEKQREQLS